MEVSNKLTQRVARQTKTPHVLLEYEDGSLKIKPFEGLAINKDKIKIKFFASGR